MSFVLKTNQKKIRHPPFLLNTPSMLTPLIFIGSLTSPSFENFWRPHPLLNKGDSHYTSNSCFHHHDHDNRFFFNINVLLFKNRFYITCLSQKLLRISYPKCYFQDLFTDIRLVVTMLPIMIVLYTILNSKFVNI